MINSTLQYQAKQFGVETEYYSAEGKHVSIDAATVSSLVKLLQTQEKQAVKYQSVYTATAQTTTLLPLGDELRLPAQTLLLSNLETQETTLVSVYFDGQNVLHLPPLSAGYYTLIADDESIALTPILIIVAPATAYEPDTLAQDNKLTGITLQLYALRSKQNWGIGDFADLAELIDYASDNDWQFIGLNPLHALFTTHPQWASPYSPSSRRWLNMMYLDMSAIPGLADSEAGQIWLQSSATQQRLQDLRDEKLVDYSGVSQMKMTALRYAYEAFSAEDNTNLQQARQDFAKFQHEQGQALYHHALFEVLAHHFHRKQRQATLEADNLGWLGWPEAYQRPDSAEVLAFAQAHESNITFFAWIQWLIDGQLRDLQDHAHAQGLALGLYGDLAVGVARGGSDTWGNRALYCLQASVGAPPDAIGLTGQNWQLPPWRPQVLQDSGFEAWIALLRANMRHYGVLRIDHVMALCRLWWIPTAHSDNKGAYVRYPLEAMMAILALESHRARCVVIGEDLGIVPDVMREALTRYQLYAYSVLYFSQNHAGYIAPSAYPKQAIAVVSTHDVAPLYGYWHERDLQAMRSAGVFATAQHYQSLLKQRKNDKQRLLTALQAEDLLDETVDTFNMNDALSGAVHQFVGRSSAKLFALQLENIQAMEASFNLPGVTTRYPNWRVKLPLSVKQMRYSNKVGTIMTNTNHSAKPKPATPKATDKVDWALTASDQAEIDAFFSAHHGDPFAFLGPHELEAGWVIRALLPDVQQAWVVDKHSAERVATMTQVDVRGFFIADMSAVEAMGYDYAYLIEIEVANQLVRFEDPYRYGSCLEAFDNWLLVEGTHLRPYEQLGAHFKTLNGVRGVNFSVWAPSAKRVSVVADFNDWDGRRHAMRFHPQSGIWELFLPDVVAGACYKFEVLDANNNVRLKADPYAFASEFRPDTASVVVGLPAKVERDHSRDSANQVDAPISIYEVHLGSWRRNTENNYWLDYEVIADELIAYVKDMGFTHIELLPVSEFPYDGSWGYQPTGLYAPTRRFGTPQQLRILVEKAHANGVNVILDWVVGHFPTDAHGLAQFDGTALYEHADPREGYHQDWNTLIYNFGRREVRNYLSGNALYWIERFGFDGLRVDAVASMIYRDYSRAEGQWIANEYGGRENLEAIDFLRRTNARLNTEVPYHLSVAEESTSFQGVTHDTAGGGLGFKFKWNMGWMNDTLRYMQQDPVHRKYHHNLMTFGMIYQYSEHFVLPLSHDEVVHGKGSILARMPGDAWQKFANIRAYYGFMWGYPGKKLLFMGNEFAQGREWNYNESLDWFLLEADYDNWHSGVQSWVRDLNHCYQQTPALHALDQDPAGFEWLVADDHDNSVFIFERRDAEGGCVIVIANFTPVVRENYRFGVNRRGAYTEILNSDNSAYNGSGVGNAQVLHSDDIGAHHKAQSLQLTIPPLATVFLRFEDKHHDR